LAPSTADGSFQNVSKIAAASNVDAAISVIGEKKIKKHRIDQQNTRKSLHKHRW
jgi:hypothetical protein